MSKYNKRSTKLSETHSTLIPFAEKLRRWAEKEDTVKKIVAGIIKRTKSSTNTYKIKHESGCVQITTKTQRTIQEVRFYVSDVVAFIERVCEYAKEQNIRVVS